VTRVPTRPEPVVHYRQHPSDYTKLGLGVGEVILIQVGMEEHRQRCASKEWYEDDVALGLTSKKFYTSKYVLVAFTHEIGGESRLGNIICIDVKCVVVTSVIILCIAAMAAGGPGGEIGPTPCLCNTGNPLAGCDCNDSGTDSRPTKITKRWWVPIEDEDKLMSEIKCFPGEVIKVQYMDSAEHAPLANNPFL